MFSEWEDFLIKEIESLTYSKSLIIWYLGGAGLAIKSPKALIYVDPYFGGSPDRETLRMIPIPINPEGIKICDALLSTHSHTDHCHKETVKAITKNTGCKFIGAKSSIAKAKNWGIGKSQLLILEQDNQYQIKDLIIESAYSYDPADKYAISFLIHWNEYHLFHSGDSHYSEKFAELGNHCPIDIAFLNFGSEKEIKWYMNTQEVLKMGKVLRAKIVVPIHWDIWKKTLPSPEDLISLVQGNKGLKVKIMLLGDRIQVPEILSNGRYS